MSVFSGVTIAVAEVGTRIVSLVPLKCDVHPSIHSSYDVWAGALMVASISGMLASVRGRYEFEIAADYTCINRPIITLIVVILIFL